MSLLRERIEALAVKDRNLYTSEDRALWDEFKAALNRGEVRAAERLENGRWRVNVWVKHGILLGFRLGSLTEMSVPDSPWRFFEKDTYPVRATTLGDGVRIVPGGSSIRDGAYIAPGVVCMPPMFINVGAYIDVGTMIDSHALVGSCAQIGKRVHLSAAAQVGGVLEPVGAVPVIIEDDVLVGGGCGVYEGTLVREGAVLAPGTILSGSTPVYDLPRGRVYRSTEESVLEIPPGAVVVPGSRVVEKGIGREWGLSLYAAVIVKYRDEKTNQAVRLEHSVR
ncbi:MAG TPA: 2,3,4,5-tetrahydropyridine-2,6-dicarboxylate N-succinyltransferase [Pyrinomonadaceae bacterium]|jgi:2,3,4,5-tetrahydropyridine-2-carboxylate N-succinyltransferase